MTLLSVRREVSEFRKRYKWMALVACLAYGGLVVRLFQLQVLEYDQWAKEAVDNITKRVRLPATRGIVRDRMGKVLADNRPSFDVYLTPRVFEPSVVAKLAQLMGLTDEQQAQINARIARVTERRKTQLVEMFTDITRDQYAAIETHQREFPGLVVISVPKRTYPFKGLAAHAIGFINEVSAEDLERLRQDGYRAGDFVGRSGIERAWEGYLRGHDGQRSVVVDVSGREMAGGNSREHVVQRDPEPGRNLRLALDMDIMRSVERAFRGHPSGAAVVVDVRTGRVRALYSKPGYDLGEMAGGLSAVRYKEIQGDLFRPLIDKTAYESYFPGSTFKPISAVAALQDGLLNTTVRFDCPGYYELGGRRFRCSHVHGEVDMRKAIVESCNVYFFKLAEVVGLDRLTRFAKDFGLGAKTGLGINTEATGFVPTREWYLKTHNNQYHLGFTLNAAIGQGNTRVTLIQLAMAYAAIANGGTLYEPQLVEAIENPDGTLVEELAPRVRRRVGVDPAHLTYVIDAMFGVVNDLSGTAYEGRIEGGVPVAGKTGTAEVAKRSVTEGEDPRRAWYDRRSHAWFAGFAPADNPELAVVVLVEHGGYGGKYAAPIATQIMQEALGGARDPLNKPVLTQGPSAPAGGAR